MARAVAAAAPSQDRTHGKCSLRGAPSYPPPPRPEPISIVELPLPPSIINDSFGACTEFINPRRTGCIKIVLTGEDSLPQAGTFTPDNTAIVATVNFTGAPASLEPASIYSGVQTILIKTDSSTFPTGDPWKCITCGDGKHFLVRANIIYWRASSDKPPRHPNNIHIYPIYWPVTANGSGPTGSMRELRLHPEDTHLSWSSLVGSNQDGFDGRLVFNPAPRTGTPLAPRYDLTNVNLIRLNSTRRLYNASNGTIKLDLAALEVGEFRGFSGSGNELIYIGYPWEACNFDGFAVNMNSGSIRRLTAHLEYVDLMDISVTTHQCSWPACAGSHRSLTLSAAQSTRLSKNNGFRRFFQAILIDRYGDRGDYFGQQINAAGDGSNGALNDPNWNARADPHFSLDGTRLIYYQTLVKTPACGGENPLPCPVSNAPDGRTTRFMLATFTDRKPQPDPLGSPIHTGDDDSPRSIAQPGNYTYKGRSCGSASMSIFPGQVSTIPSRVRVDFHDLSDDGETILHGYENISTSALATWLFKTDWASDIITGHERFNITMNVQENFFNATRTLSTVVDGVVYRQPLNLGISSN
ncbi:hypothetical protein BDW74DRAFT_167052 [Aspergillus multicolor]|uniref:uncharacterized protein n=1 Tax=Aspergillus multicolor TaxID=41759 RepID=UPI003CCD1444